MAAEWPLCLRVVAATAALTEEAAKFTLEQRLEVLTPHQVRVILETKVYLQLRGYQLTKYQVMLLNTSELIIKHTLQLTLLL